MDPISAFLKHLSPRTLMGRAIAIIVAPMALLLMIATAVFYERHWDAVTRRLALGVAGDVAMIVDNLDNLTRAGLLTSYLQSAREQLLITFTFDDYATLPATPARTVQNRILDVNLTQALIERLRRPLQIDTTIPGDYLEIRVQLDNGVASARVHKDRLTSATTTWFVLAMVGAGGILLAIAILFLRNQIRPIRHLADAADAFGKGRDVQDFKVWGAIEVRQAAAAFNTMRNRLRRFVAQRTEMLAGVSHDLRTPLTRMRLQLAMLGESAATANLKSDVDEMEAMVNGYLAFARNQDTETAVETDLPRLLQQVAVNARRQGANVALTTTGNLTVPLHPNAFLRCMTNLVDNARQYASHIAISAARVGNNIEILVDDDGPGIPPEKRELAFQPFRRLNDTWPRSASGLGLGLAIARDVVRSHGGEISLGTAPMGGLRAILRLPV
ncbi:MAG: HAMP domain-containing protein [Alphaproteobacteria bacterium]|nr:HAMP domain-containing protein [Alphaproteobacteria bacterium]